MKEFIILLSFVINSQIVNNNENKKLYRCNIDDNYINPLPAPHYIKIENKNNLLANKDFKDFHIYLDLLNIKNGIKKYHLEQYEELFINSLNKAIKTLENLLKVKNRKYRYKFNDEDIKKINIDYWNKSMIGTNSIGDNDQLDIDLYIFGKFDNKMENSIIVKSRIEYIEIDNGRPIIGSLNINANIDYSKINLQEYFDSIIIHEFIHILGFTNYYFSNFMHNIYSKKDEYGINHFYINSSKVLDVAKKYYNYSNIEGVELEESRNKGKPGSHWKGNILLGEIMNEVKYTEEQITSEFTLALLEETGYYKANYDKLDLIKCIKEKGPILKMEL